MQSAMHDQFIDFVSRHDLLQTGDKALLALSGGMDSMVMAELFRTSPFPFAIAHCNFQLRGKESESDQELVGQLAASLGAEFFTKRFPTTAYARERGISVQMAARELRYHWMEEVRQSTGAAALATAHHLDDAIETLLLNLVRGTGPAGLRGIPVKNRQVIRPMLFTGREAISAFAAGKGIRYREDLSNKEEKYLRNKLRVRVMPVLRDLNPDLTHTMGQFFEIMQGAEAARQMMVERQRKDCMRYHGKEARLLIAPLKQLPNPEYFLYELLKDYGFGSAVCRDIYRALDTQPGKTFISPTHSLIKDRDTLLIFPYSEEKAAPSARITENTRQLSIGDHSFRFASGPVGERPPWPKDQNTLLADRAKLRFPLLLRPWHEGDKMKPLGMKGHKKVSDLLTGAKIPRHHKGRVMVLTSEDRIVWVAGIRSDERFKLDDQSREYYLVSLGKPT